MLKRSLDAIGTFRAFLGSEREKKFQIMKMTFSVESLVINFRSLEAAAAAVAAVAAVAAAAAVAAVAAVAAAAVVVHNENRVLDISRLEPSSRKNFEIF